MPAGAATGGRRKAGRPVTSAAVAAGALFIAQLVILTAGVWLAFTRPAAVEGFTLEDLAWGVALMLPFPAVGAVLAARLPSNRLAWLFLIGPLLASSGVALGELAFHQGAEVSAWVLYLSEAAFLAGIGIVAAFFLLLFPDGTPASRRFRLIARLGGLGVAGIVVWTFLQPCMTHVLDSSFDGRATCDTVSEFVVTAPNLFGIDSAGIGGVHAVLGTTAALLIFGALISGVWSLVLRHRRGTAAERAQLKWPLAVVAVAVSGLVTGALAEELLAVDLTALTFTMYYVAMVGLPVAIGVAIARYRLFDIDRLISRTVTYLVVVIALGAVYAVLAVIPFLFVVGAGGGQAPTWLVAGSTLVAVALFSPLRDRVQRIMDRRFNRTRYDAVRVVEQFAAEARDLTELSVITAGVGSAVQGALQPSVVSVWLRRP